MRLLNAHILAGNAARSDMLIAVSHIHLYFVKRSVSETIAKFKNPLLVGV